MGKLNAFIEAQTAPLGLTEYTNGLCPNRALCFRTRLNISEEAIEDGWRCAFEEHHQLWQCHLSGKWKEPEPETT